MRRRLMPAVVLAGALVLVACGDDGVAAGDGRDVVDGPARGDAHDDVARGPGRDDVDGPAPTDTHDEPPYGPGVQVGETYDYQLYTHCGVEWGRVDGVWWRTQPLGVGTAAPPSGWGDPYDAGRLRVVDETTAVYSGGPGVDIEFERTDLTEAPSLCL